MCIAKRARKIYNLDPRASLRENFKEINILTLTSQQIFEIYCEVKCEDSMVNNK